MRTNDTTRTNKTTIRYKVRAIQLINRAGKAIGNSQPTMCEIVIWLINIQPSLSRATWRQYKAALICYLENLAFENTACSADAEDAINLLHSTDPKHCKRHGLHTSGKKQKKISKAEQEKLIAYYVNNPIIRHGITTLAWLLSGIFTGLRPLEWQSAQLIINSTGGSELHVKNAKNTNKRSHGEDRIIHLSNITDSELEIIRLQLINVTAALGKSDVQNLENTGLEDLYRNCRDCLYKANRKLWPRKTKFISLYSARHQFAADAKKSGLSKEAIAALMGHASVETAGTHYGRRVSGRGGFRVKADQSDIDRVEQLYADRLDAKFCNDSPRT